MKRVLLKVSYDGAAYHGWQIQSDEVTVEGVLNEKLSELTGEDIEVIGASRTDAGVHALGNVAVFDTESTIPPERFSYALNTMLPEDISVVESFEVPADFHPRKTDTEKTYEYTILNSKFPIPGRRGYTWHVKVPLDVDKMRSAASVLIGPHDFRGFCSSKTQAESTVRTIYSIYVFEENIKNISAQKGTVNGGGSCKARAKEQHKDDKDQFPAKEIKIQVCGDGFLYNMVRIIAGTLASAGGLGKVTTEDIERALRTGDRTLAGLTAPPQGLCLVDIWYPELEEY